MRAGPWRDNDFKGTIRGEERKGGAMKRYGVG